MLTPDDEPVYHVCFLISVYIRAQTEEDAIRLAQSSTSNWEDWNVSDTPGGISAAIHSFAQRIDET